jgi:hypothetical protein
MLTDLTRNTFVRKLRMRLTLSILFLAACFSGIAVIFWQQEYQYRLPAPVPANYQAVPVGQAVSVRGFSHLPQGPLFLHFYNPDCPCSRFNARHLKSLIRQYGDSVRLFIVVPTREAKHKAVSEFGDGQDYLVDDQLQLAHAYGVYATPQAVLVDREGKLFYRGNYNKSRYCTTKATNYAELALVALLNHQNPPAFDFFATEAYGCSLAEDERTTQLNFF